VAACVRSLRITPAISTGIHGTPMSSLILDVWREACQACLSLVFAEACALCHADGGGPCIPALCDRCVAALPRLEEPRCAVCGEWFLGAVPSPFRCLNCADREFAFEFATAPYRARAGLLELIHQFKYKRQLWLAKSLGRLLAEGITGPNADPRFAGEEWLLVPVPLHPRRMREREFNQAWELAVVAGRQTGLRVVNALRRVRYTTVQASLARHDRLANLRNAFCLRAVSSGFRRVPVTLNGKAVLLIDDVFTTGATADACARVLLRDGGARRVVALTLARG